MKHEFVWKKRFYGRGEMTSFDIGNYHISVIADGCGSDHGLYEIGIFEDSQFVHLPGINGEDGIKGWLTLEEVDCILTKIDLISH